MTKHVEDAPNGTPYTHPQKHDENVPELHGESVEEDSDEEEFPPKDVQYDPSQESRFSSRGPADARAVSLSTARKIQAAKDQAKNNQSQSNNQSITQRPSPVPPRQVDPKRYGK